jgi:type 1 glutamine amidotransferase
MTGANIPDDPNAMPKNILMISDGRIHPPLMGRFWLRYALAGIKDCTFTRVSSIEKLLKFDLSSIQGLVLYFHHDDMTREALDVFDKFVSDGGGVLAIHSATASFKNHDHFTDILGGKFVDHSPVEPFTVSPVASGSQIFQDILEFSVRDELYIHDLQPDIEVHFTTLFEDRPVPMVWTRMHGKGRVCYACPGHRAASMRVPAYQQILIRGLEWVCGT